MRTHPATQPGNAVANERNAVANEREFVHVTLNRTRDTEVLEHYIYDRASHLSSFGFEVLWYEVVVTGNRPGQSTSARVTCHLAGDTVVAVVGDQGDEFLAVRTVFDLLGCKLGQRDRTVVACLSCGATDDLIVPGDSADIAFCVECLTPDSALDFPMYYSDHGGEA